MVEVRLFAAARDLAGSPSLRLELPANAKVADLRNALVARLPALGDFGRRLRFAVNMQYAEDPDSIPGGADLACIPPVSGG